MGPVGEKGQLQKEVNLQEAKLEKKSDQKTKEVVTGVNFQPSDAKIDLKEKRWTILGIVTAFLEIIHGAVLGLLHFITGRTAGRKVLQNDMKTFPEQLERDVLGRGTFFIGKTSYPEVENANPKELLKKTGDDLTAYIHEANPTLEVDEEVLKELLYASVQNFCAPAIARIVQLYDASVWVGKQKETVRVTSYKMEEGESPVLLHIMQKTEQTIVNSKDESAAHKKATSLTDIQYNLRTKEVLFHYICTLDDTQIEWTTQDPFKI